MKHLKLMAVLSLLLILTACGKEDAHLLSYTAQPKEPVVQQAPQQIQADFTVMIDGQTMEPGGVYFGGKWFVSWDGLSEALDLTEKPELSLSVAGMSFVSLDDVCRDFDGVVLKDGERDHVYIITQDGQWQIPEGYRVPILMYHGVSDNMWGMTDLFIKPSEMEAQIVWILENGYTPIWFEDLPRVNEIEKPVMLTYDDGYVDNYVDLFPILKKYNVKATIFVVTGTADYNPNSLTTQQIKELSDSGLVSIQSHTVTHPYLRGMTREQQEYELTKSYLDIAHITGKAPTVICYPSGSYDDTTMELAKQYYRMGINMNGNDYVTGEDPYLVDRFYITRRDPLQKVIGCIQ